MKTPVEITSRYDAHDDLHELRVKEGEREMMVLASMKEGKIEFCYYRIWKWEYPFHEYAFTDQDRARLADRIFNHYTAQGWQVEIDRRRPCPRCGEKLDGSDSDGWPGGIFNFCGKEIYRFGKIVQSYLRS